MTFVGTARYWQSMYLDQLRRKRSLHERYIEQHKRLRAARSERDFWRQRYEDQHRTLHSAEDEIARLRDEAAVREVLSALKPLADLAVEVDELNHADDSTCLWRLRAGDIRAARDVVARWPSFSGEEGT